MKDEATLSPAVIHAIRVREKFHEESMRATRDRQPAFAGCVPGLPENPKPEF
jgi:hypothetical protein